MLPFPQDSMQSAAVGRHDRIGHVGWPTRAAIAVAAAVWLSCSAPEPFRGGQGGLTSTGAGGVAGSVGQAGTPGVDASTAGSGAAGSTDAGAPTGVAGDNGGTAGSVGQTGTAGDAGAPTTGTAGAGGSNSAAGAGGGTAGAGSGVAGTGAAGAGAAGSGAAGSSTGAAGSAPPPTARALPGTGTDHIAPTGFMGDGIVAGSVTMTADPTACNGEPAAAMAGVCYTVVYRPQPIVAPAPSTWGGVYWQYPDNNWGTMQPQMIASGAKDISFYAKGMAGGEAVTFQAGGILNTVSAATPYTDTFTIRQTFTLTTTWTKYTLSMTGLTYGQGVLGGFAWVATAVNANPVTFFVHGVVWE